MNKWKFVSRLQFLLWLCASSLLLTSCSENKVAGGTEAESTIALQVLLADGTPASMARVRILPKDYLADSAAEKEWDETDKNGQLSFDAPDGNYAIEVRNVDASQAMGAVLYVSLDAKKADSVVETLKLSELSTIEGYVVLGESSPVVRVAGLDRYVVPDSAGHFVIDSLPQGNYDVQFGEPSEAYSAKVNTSVGAMLFVDASDADADIKIIDSKRAAATEYPEGDWAAHEALLKNLQGYAEGTLGAAGKTDSMGKINKAKGEICVVTTTDDFIEVSDSTKVAPGSFRECAEKDGPVWILFKNDGAYNLQSPLRIKSNKTIDGRGRNVRITGMGILTNESSNLIFENLTFTAPAITAQDTTSHRALSIHNTTHHVWVDHCTFEEYPLIELDVKRSSHHVTVSWNRFENAQSGILFGLEPDIYVDSAQTLTLHHNYFANLEAFGVLARHGKMHAYNNFFFDVKKAGVECSESALCAIEFNVFNVEKPVVDYRLENEDGTPDESTLGYVYMKNNLFGRGGENVAPKSDFDYDYTVLTNIADAELAVEVKNAAGPR